MTPFQKRTGWALGGALFLAWSLHASQERFLEGRALLPSGSQGLYRVLVLEEPQVLLPRQKGDRGTGLSGDRYLPGVTEVRSHCLLLSREGDPLPPLKVRCSFRLAKDRSTPVLSYGDKIEFRGKVQVPKGALNPGQFDHERYLRIKGVAFTAFLGPGQWVKLEAPPEGNPFLRVCYRLKRLAQSALCRNLPYPESALLDGILLGERSALPKGMLEDFFLTGTVHILAVSGLMTAFVSGILFLGLRGIGFPRKGAALLALAGLACFVCMTGADPPVCRAGLFSALALGAVLFERKVHGGRLLWVTAVLLVLLDPFTLLDLSFQISFLATAGLMAGTPWAVKKFAFLGRHLAGLLATTLCAQLSVWYLLAHLFNQATPYSILANLMVVPLALLATLLGLGVLGGAALHPWLGEILGTACSWVLKALTACAGWIASFPGGEGLVPSSPVFFVLVFHLLLGAACLVFWPRPVPESPGIFWRKERQGRLRIGRWVLGAWGIFAFLGIAYGALSFLGPEKLRVVLLAVGHGNAAVLEAPGGHVLVVDGGRGTRGLDRYHPLVAYLRHRGIEEVDWVLATHPDYDHWGGLMNLAGACRLGSVFLPDSGQAAPFPKGFLEKIKEEGIHPILLGKGDRPVLAGRLKGTVLHPDGDFVPRRNPDNDLSLAVRFQYGETTFLFPGDLEKEGLLRLLSWEGARERVDWLLAPHHGRRSGEPFLSAQGFLPRFVVLSDGRDHPASAEDYRRGSPGVEVLSTARDGALELEVKPDGSGRYRVFREGSWKALRPRVPPPVGGPKVDFIEKQGL